MGKCTAYKKQSCVSKGVFRPSQNSRHESWCRDLARRTDVARRTDIARKVSTFLIILMMPFIPYLFPSCASIGNPTGGDYDTIPPVFVYSKPAPNSINFSGNRIELFFDEFISIEKPSEKVIITPPQEKAPVIKPFGKKITIELKDSLISNTTYTFDFTNSIVDNNENNAIEGFTFAFSTGDVIDSLLISGILLNAENLEPMPNIMVGLHSNLSDSAFTSIPFVRTSMTNERGQFWIRNIAPGTYRLFALNDQNRNYKFDQIKEDIAFCDTTITPGFISDIRMDTMRIDSLTIDSIKEIRYNKFIPDDIVLFLFKEKEDRQFLLKYERPTDRQLIFRFNSDQGLPPEIFLLDENLEDDISSDWLIPEYSNDKKDITYWIKDSLHFSRDTILVEANYMITDSLNNLILARDTLRFPWRNREPPKKDNRKESETKIDFMKINISAKSVMDVFDTLKITFPEPVMDFDLDKIRIQQKVDTLWEKRSFPIVVDSLNPRIFYVDYQWPYEQEYRIIIDSAAIFSIYGKWNDSTATQFKLNSEKEYGNLFVKINGEAGSGFGELLDNSDRVVRKSALIEGELVFYDLKPGSYFLRYIEDLNGNGKWDTGNFKEQLQPEKVYYYHDALSVLKNGENEIGWDIKQTPIEKQKPLDITKNKPAVKQAKRTDPKDQRNQRDQNRQQNIGGQSIPGMGGRSIPRL